MTHPLWIDEKTAPRRWRSANRCWPWSGSSTRSRAASPGPAFTRTPNGQFPEYHTSADNPDFLSADALGESWLACLKVLEILDCDRHYVNLQPKGEPQLGRRGLYRPTGGYQDVPERQLALLWVLNQSDGTRSLLEIAERASLPFSLISGAAADLHRVGLLAVAAD